MGTTSPNQSGPKGTLPRAPEIEPHQQIQLSVILRTLHVESYPPRREYKLLILSQVTGQEISDVSLNTGLKPKYILILWEVI